MYSLRRLPRAAARTYSAGVRTVSGLTRIYAAGWLVSGLITVAAFRQWHGRLEEAEERAAEIERTRDQAALRRAAEERLRIARELHDSLTHSISVIKVQAGVATHLARKRGEPVPDALAAIEEAAADASRELRQALTVLRRDDGVAGQGLADLPGLLDRTRSAGIRVTHRSHGLARPLPPEVDLAAYRIVQEALTNVARHAGPNATASVSVTFGDAVLTLQVDDDGESPASDGSTPGLGLIGMRERATGLGGRLTAGSREGGGFRVRAELPLESLESTA